MLVWISPHNLLKLSRAIIVVRSEKEHVKLQVFPIWGVVNSKKNSEPRMNILNRINVLVSSQKYLRMIYPTMIYANKELGKLVLILFTAVRIELVDHYNCAKLL